MMVSPMYTLAFVFLLTTTILWGLWHCRARILARIMRSEGLDIEIGRDFSIPGAAYAEPVNSSATAAAPAFIIGRLPVYTYPYKEGDNKCSSTDSTGAGAAVLLAAAQQQHQHHETQLQQQRRAADAPQQTSADQQEPEQQQQHEAQQLSWIQKLILGQRQQQQAPTHTTDTSTVNDQQHQSAQHGVRELHTVASSAAAVSAFKQQAHQDDSSCSSSTSQHSESMCDSDSCIICFSAYVPGDLIKQLPCEHHYHAACIDKWLLRSGCCPLCKAPIWQPQNFLQDLDQLAQQVTGLQPQQQQQLQTHRELQQRRQRLSGSSSGSFEGSAAASGAGVAGATASRARL